MTALDTWVTYDPESDLSSKFGSSLVARAKRRSVIEHDGRFIVPGNPSLGDCYDTYTITFDGRLYHCSCRDHLGGQYRKVCSHALAVMLYRKTARQMGGGRDDPAPQPGEDESARQPLASIPAPFDPMFGDNPPLPDWVQAIRPHQWEAVQEIVAAFNAGDQVVCLDAPTGSGKTLLAELVRRILGVRAIYVCSTKTLQDQAAADFPYARVLKGRANYPTLDHPERFDLDWSTRLTAAECTKRKATLPACSSCPEDVSGESLHCSSCHPWFNCPYEVAKQDALHAPLAILNTSYFLTEANAVGKFAGADLVIIDEADLLENELMGQVEVRVSPFLASSLELDPPDKVTVEESWVTWVADDAIPTVSKALKKLRGDEPAVIRRRIRMERLSTRLKQLEAGLGNGNWVYTGDRGEISFRPIRVNEIGPGMLWAHGKRFLLMSASLIDPVELMESLGYAGGQR